MKYLCATGDNIGIVGYFCNCDDISKNTSKKGLLGTTIGSGKDIFDKYEIPEEYQKMFFKIPFSIKKASLADITWLPGKEYFFNIKMDIKRRDTQHNFYSYSGYVNSSYHGFYFYKGYFCELKEILEFYGGIKANGLETRYVAALGEMMSINMLAKKSLEDEAAQMILKQNPNKKDNQD